MSRLQKWLSGIAATGLIGLLSATGALANDDIIYVEPEDLEAYWLNDHRPLPHYPLSAARDGTEGCVAIGYIIEPDGTVSTTRVLTAHPETLFAASAVALVEDWTYRPAADNLDAVAVFTHTIVTFQLEKPGSESLRREQLKGQCKPNVREMLGGGRQQ